MLAHSELFIGTAWYRKVMPHHWCEAVGIRREDSPVYIDTIATNLTGTHPTAFTLAAIEKSNIYCNLPDDCPEMLVVGHLKVEAQYQRRGVGSMLLTAGQTSARQRGWRAARPGSRCWPKIGRPETAMRKQVSGKFLALMQSLLKASTMKCNGCKWPVLFRASRPSGAGRGRGKRAAVIAHEIPVQVA